MAEDFTGMVRSALRSAMPGTNPRYRPTHSPGTDRPLAGGVQVQPRDVLRLPPPLGLSGAGPVRPSTCAENLVRPLTFRREESRRSSRRRARADHVVSTCGVGGARDWCLLARDWCGAGGEEG
eukprot:3790053-Rhodomonas_salina.1